MPDRLFRFAARLALPTATGQTVQAHEIEVYAAHRDAAWQRLHDAAVALGALHVVSARVVLEVL